MDVVELLMAAYQSAEQERTLAFPPEGLETFVPAVARGRGCRRSASRLRLLMSQCAVTGSPGLIHAAPAVRVSRGLHSRQQSPEGYFRSSE